MFTGAGADRSDCSGDRLRPSRPATAVVGQRWTAARAAPAGRRRGAAGCRVGDDFCPLDVAPDAGDEAGTAAGTFPAWTGPAPRRTVGPSAVPPQIHIGDRVRAADYPGDQREDLGPHRPL